MGSKKNHEYILYNNIASKYIKQHNIMGENKLLNDNLFRCLNILLSKIGRLRNQKQAETWEI